MCCADRDVVAREDHQLLRRGRGAVLQYGRVLALIPGCQPYTRWITGNASSIVVIGNTSNSIHGVYFMVSS